jgi:hypothetical protein
MPGLQMVHSCFINSIGALKGQLKISNCDSDLLIDESKEYQNVNAALSEVVAHIGNHTHEFTRVSVRAIKQMKK